VHTYGEAEEERFKSLCEGVIAYSADIRGSTIRHAAVKRSTKGVSTGKSFPVSETPGLHRGGAGSGGSLKSGVFALV